MDSNDPNDEARLRAPDAQPATGIPKTIGVLNIIFGALLLMCALWQSLQLLANASFGPMMMAWQQQFQQAMQAERQKQLQQLQEQEKAAQEEKAKAELRNKQKALQAQPIPKMPDMTRFLRDSTFQAYMIVEVATGMILNILLVISGIGLVGYKEWGRQLALWVAALKIVCLVGFNTYYALVIVPEIADQFTGWFREFFDEMAKAAPPGQKMPGAGEIAQIGTVLGIMLTAFAIGMVLFGVIYPVIVLIALTRPRAKAACASGAAESASTESDQPPTDR